VDGNSKRRAGRPPTVRGRRVAVYLDGATVGAARELGAGNVSDGVRRAVKLARAVLLNNDVIEAALHIGRGDVAKGIEVGLRVARLTMRDAGGVK